MLARHSPLPVPSHQSNFGTQARLSPENQDDVEMEGPPSLGPQCWELTTLWVVRLDNDVELKVTDPKEQQQDVEEEETEDEERRE